jgi:hypothetical protein
MAETLAHSYAAITKADKNADGTLTVYGKATDDSIDIDQQICDDEWLKRAMPDWMMAGGNVREQHSNIAAGVATEYESKKDGHYITALVVDPVSVKKVETGVLKGFSIGIRGPRVIRDQKAAGGRIIDGQIVEISLVDRPANPNAKLILAKSIDGELVKTSDTVENMNTPSPADVARAINKNTTDPIGDAVDAIKEEVVAFVEETADAIADAVAEVADDVEAGIRSGADALTHVIEGLGDSEAEKAAALLNLSKTFVAELNKFDQATFDRARTELANLIIVEAQEMIADGGNEKDSIEELLDAVKHLFRWYKGEVAEGEVAGEMAPTLGDYVADLIDGKAVDAEEGEMCPDCDKEMTMCKCDYKTADTEDSTEKSMDIDEATTVAIVEKAVAQAKESVREELALLKAAFEAEKTKTVTLADELETAKKAVAGGGPKRAATTKPDTNVNTLLQKAAEYSVKASNTVDPVLAQGYRELSEEFATKASRKDVTN